MKKGQIVFVKHSSRYGTTVTKCVVMSIGSKYFKLDELDNKELYGIYSRIKFSVEDMCEVTKYSSEYRVYLTEKEIQDEFDRPDIKLKIDIHLSGLTTDELRETLEILTKKFK